MEIINLKQTNRAEVVKKSATVLKRGGLVVYPTDTCFGLGADATDSLAVDKVFEFKGERHKPMAVAVDGRRMAEKYVLINETAANLYENFLPGRLTVISRSRGRSAPRLESDQGTLGVRIPDYLLVREIIKKFGRPITTTSANISGIKPPYSLADFNKYTSRKKRDMVDLFLDPGPLPERKPSTVVDTTFNETAVLRQGEIAFKEISGQVFNSDSEEETRRIGEAVFKRFARFLPDKAILFSLQGELGAGKTQFAKGIAKGLGIEQNINSPTFNLVKEYPFGKSGDGVFYHVDTWRIREESELIDLGLAEMLKAGNVAAIEWPQKAVRTIQALARRSGCVLVWVALTATAKTKRSIKFKFADYSDF